MPASWSLTLVGSGGKRSVRSAFSRVKKLAIGNTDTKVFVKKNKNHSTGEEKQQKESPKK